MAKMFYSAEEAAQKLGKTEAELKDLVRAGTLREFRDGDKVNYKAEEIDAMAPSGGSAAASGSASGEIILEPADDSGIDLGGSGSDILSLEELDSGDTSAQTKSGKEDTAARQKSDSVVPSVGVNVFDDDELDEAVDPLAQTAVTDVGGLGIDGIGSGSGILDLTKESDDTSLGAELLDEIYSGDSDATKESVDDTRPGLDEAIEEVPEGQEFDVEVDTEDEPSKAAAKRPVAAVDVAEGGADALATGLTAALVVAVVVLWFAGLAGASMVRGVVPSLLQTAYDNLLICAGGALALAIIGAGVTFLLVRRGS